MPVFKLLFFRDVKNKLRKNFVVPVLSDKWKCLSTQISYDLDKIYLPFAMLRKKSKFYVKIILSKAESGANPKGFFEDLNPQSRYASVPICP